MQFQEGDVFIDKGLSLSLPPGKLGAVSVLMNGTASAASAFSVTTIGISFCHSNGGVGFFANFVAQILHRRSGRYLVDYC